MSVNPVKKISPAQMGLTAAMLVLAGVGLYIVKTVLSDDGNRQKRSVAVVTLLKLPPPVALKEKPPEPEQAKEVPKQEAFVDPGPKNESQSADNDPTPSGDNLGVDAEGGAGGDSFGLVGKKGGRSLLAGGDGMGKISLLARYSDYAHFAETEIRKKVMKRLDEDGGIPKGKLQAVVQVRMDNDGAVVAYKIVGSSGNNVMDEAIKQALANIHIEPPPDGMPRTIVIRFTSQG